MKVGIMQPYFLPYIGYFQLINAVDKYVIYDDVNFIKGGWINRNRILLNNEAFMFNIPMAGASSFKKINEINIGKNKDKLLITIQQAYKKAPFYNKVIPLIDEIIQYNNENLALFISNSIIRITEYLNINTEIILSSEIVKNNDLKAQEKVISICKAIGASEYYNTIGGKELYDRVVFANNNIELMFLKPKQIEYIQFKNKFIPWLSILDVMMFNSQEEVRDMLNKYECL
ncbi:MAG: WbqC family protein [Bacteroidales bacterium]|jgi:hypothetical protein|nr:WbqC family protein [Bacteroidales bacterium]